MCMLCAITFRQTMLCELTINAFSRAKIRLASTDTKTTNGQECSSNFPYNVHEKKAMSYKPSRWDRLVDPTGNSSTATYSYSLRKCVLRIQEYHGNQIFMSTITWYEQPFTSFP